MSVINPFESLPDELLLEQCKYLDSKSLLGTAQGYQRLYHVCKEIIESRK